MVGIITLVFCVNRSRSCIEGIEKHEYGYRWWVHDIVNGSRTEVRCLGKGIGMVLLSTVLALVFSTSALCLATSDPLIHGTAPQPLTPYSTGDPIPKLTLTVHPRQETPRQVVESFLSYLSQGLNLSNFSYAGGTVPGIHNGYEKAWELLNSKRPSLQEFKRQWSETVRLGVVQLEPVDDTHFFVELERLQLCGDHWAVAYYSGELTAVKTTEGWRIGQFKAEPENLVSVNLAGHQAWIHNIQPAARTVAGPGWDVEEITYERRIANVKMKNKTTGAMKTVRLSRLVEGRWVPLTSNRGS